MTVRGAGEASLWFADYSNFDAAQSAQWEAVPGPPVYWGGGSTPSGQAFVSTTVARSGHMVFFADNSHVHMSAGRPTRTSAWYRLDGRGIAACRRMNALWRITSMCMSIHTGPWSHRPLRLEAEGPDRRSLHPTTTPANSTRTVAA